MRKWIWLGVLAGSAVGYGQCPEPLRVGYRTVTGNGRTIAVWYPTTATEAAVSFGRLSGSAAVDGPVAGCARFPVVLFSHGFSGCNTQSVTITETLARRGYIVAAPNHRDAACGSEGGTGVTVSFTQPETWTEATYADRREDMKATLDWLLASPEFGAAADRDRVGAAGHSLGGYTVIGLTGGWPGANDARIRAALLFSPYLQPYLLQNRLAGMNVPVQYQGGTLDIGITPFVDGSRGSAYALSNAPKLYLSLPRAGHLEWTNTACARTVSTVADCLRTEANARTMLDYASDFLDRFLKGKEVGGLWTRQSGLAEFRRLSLATAVSAASYMGAQVLAGDSIGAMFGDALSTGTAAAASVPLPVTLGGTSVSIEDETGKTHAAPLFFVSSGQVNFLLPGEAAAGTAKIAVRNGAEMVAAGTMQVGAVSPGIFTAAGSGRGVPAAESLLVAQNGTRTAGLVFDPRTLAPVALDARGGGLYVILYGTGFRRASVVRAMLAGRTVPVLGVSATPGFFGLDQVAIGPFPADAAAGVSELRIAADGVDANPVLLTIR
jgi:uncharacterized protein (TIGR03437 family)